MRANPASTAAAYSWRRTARATFPSGRRRGPPGRELRSPRSVGRYELRERIGEGALAEVWRAHDSSIDRVLAIKLLEPEFLSNPAYTSCFLREAKAAGVLAHSLVVTIYDVGEADGRAYITSRPSASAAGAPFDVGRRRVG